MIIPHGRLSAEALANVIEEYVSRDGTESSEVTEKSAAVLRLLEAGELLLAYDPVSESCNLITREAYSAAREEQQPDD